MKRFPTTGHPAESGARPAQQGVLPSSFRGVFIRKVEMSFLSCRKKPNERDVSLWRAAKGQVEKGWLGGPRPCALRGKLFWNNETKNVNPAFRLGVQRGAKLRAVGDLDVGETIKASAVHVPINLPLWGPILQVSAVCRCFGAQGFRGRCGVAKADLGDADNQPSHRAGGEHSAVVTLRTPQ